MGEPTSGRPSNLSLIVQQTRSQNKLFWRTPVAAFFTLVFPLMLFVLFTAIFGNEPTSEGLTPAQFFAPSLAAFAAVSATYTNLAINTAMSRDAGILKRVRGTPLPPWIFLAGRVGSAVYMAILAVVIMMGVGWAAYGVEIRLQGIPGAALAFVSGVACFAALGLLVAAVAPSGDTAPAVTNGTLLPLAFVSDIFFNVENPPQWMEVIGNIFPLKHFVVAFREPLYPFAEGWSIHWGSIAYILLWTVVAAALAIRFFRWEPKTRAAKKDRDRANT